MRRSTMAVLAQGSGVRTTALLICFPHKETLGWRHGAC
jgi:hypothetical protein